MDITIGRGLEIGAVIVLTSYFPLLTYSFFKYRLIRKQEELIMLMEKTSLLEVNIDKMKERIKKEYELRDYLLPLIFVTSLTLLGMTLLFLAWSIYEFENDAYSSVLFSGSDFWMMSDTLVIEKRSVAVLAFALMGSYINASQYIYRRFATIDLTPGNFFSVGLRMILSALVSMLLAFVVQDTFLANSNMILAIAFLTGFFPETGFKLLLDKVRIFSSKMEQEFKNCELGHIEGISDMHQIRLKEIGIDNVQNLAQYNFFMLIIKTPFPIRTLLDWCAQAKLLVEFQEDSKKLRKVGIRNALDYMDAMNKHADRIDEISTITGINKLALEINHQNIKNDKSIELLMKFRHHQEGFHLD